MSNNNRNYYLYVNKKKIEVSKEIYKIYWKSIEQERYLLKKMSKTCIYLDSLFDGYERNSVEIEAIKIKDQNIQIQLENHELQQKLIIALRSLPKNEFDLIHALYYQGLSQREYARMTNQKQNTISWKHKKIINKLRNMVKF